MCEQKAMVGAGLGNRRRHRRQDDAELVLPGVFDAHGLQFADQQPAQLQLARRTGIGLRIHAGGGVDLHVAEKALQQAAGVHGG